VERDILEKPSWASPDLLGEKLGLRYEDRGSRERPSAFWRPVPVKKHGPRSAADLRLVTPSGDPV
jgi:hypothetical protein